MEEVRGSNPLSPDPPTKALVGGHFILPDCRSGRWNRLLLTKLLTNVLVLGNSASIALVPRVSTGRSSLRYTSSVMRVLAWPEMGDVLDGHPLAGQQRYKAVAEFSRCPGHRIHVGRGNDHLECTADVGRVKWGAGGCAEHQVGLLQLVPAFSISASRPFRGESSRLPRSEPATRGSGATSWSWCLRAPGQTAKDQPSAG